MSIATKKAAPKKQLQTNEPINVRFTNQNYAAIMAGINAKMLKETRTRNNAIEVLIMQALKLAK